MAETRAFTQRVITPVWQHLQRLGGTRNVEVTSLVDWDLEQGQGLELVARMPGELLNEDFQQADAAAPTYLLCLAYWLQQAQPATVTCRLEVLASPPPGGKARGHRRRSLFLLDQYAALLSDRFSVVFEGQQERWEWPSYAVFNSPGDRPALKQATRQDEYQLEKQICEDEQLRQDFNDNVAPIQQFDRQLPVGLFETEVKGRRCWTVCGKSAVDLWSVSPDQRTFHLFELKDRANDKAGIIAEAFYYARLLHHVQTGLPNGKQIRLTGPELQLQRQARRTVMWLTAPDYHPLVFGGGDTPLAWLNAQTEPQGLSLRVLPFELDARHRITRWCPERAWPGVTR